MYAVTLLMKNSPVALSYTFKAHKKAEEFFKLASSNIKKDVSVDIEDDFEMKSSIDMMAVASVSFSEYTKEMKKNGEIQLLQAKADIATQTQAKNDVGLRIAGDALNRAGPLPGEFKLVKEN